MSTTVASDQFMLQVSLPENAGPLASQLAMKFVRGEPELRHCEERSDEAIQDLAARLDCFASLAMTKLVAWIERSEIRERPASFCADPGFHFRLRAPRFGGLIPAEARRASQGGSFNPGYGNSRSYFDVNLFNSIGDKETAMQSQEFTANGVWVCPQSVSAVFVQGQGGGGGGGGGDTGLPGAVSGGGGGASGALAYAPTPVIPGTSYDIVIGAGGGGGGAGVSGGRGGATAFGNLVVFPGGAGGGHGFGDLYPRPGPGGTGSNCSSGGDGGGFPGLPGAAGASYLANPGGAGGAAVDVTCGGGGGGASLIGAGGAGGSGRSGGAGESATALGAGGGGGGGLGGRGGNGPSGLLRVYW